jgi:hypothetical protein
MKRMMIILYVLTAGFCYAQGTLKDRVFDLCFNQGDNKINYITMDEILSEIQAKKINPVLVHGGHIEPDIDDNIKDIALWFGRFFKYDVDGDGGEEIIVEQTRGSGAIPFFFILKYDSNKNQYYSAYEGVRGLWPFMFEGQLIFYEEFYNFHSGIFETINVAAMNTGYELQNICSFDVEFKYNLETEAQKYITGEEIYNIQRHDYNFLNEYIVSKETFVNNNTVKIQFGAYTVEAGTIGTTAWSFYMNAYVYNTQDLIKEFFNICGFTIREIDNRKYLAIMYLNERGYEYEEHSDYQGLYGGGYIFAVYDLVNFQGVYKRYHKAVLGLK